MTGEIDFLVNETFRHARTSAVEPGGHSLFSDNKVSFHKSPGDGPGLLYSIQFYPEVFVVRAIPCENLEKEWKESLKEGKQQTSLRLDLKRPLHEQVFWFSTPFVEQAKDLSLALCHRRLPRHEERVCNVSDPGYSFWMKSQESSFQIFYKLAQTQQIENLIKIGPLGEPKEIHRTLKNLVPFLYKMIPGAQIIAERSHFSLLAEDGDAPQFLSLKELFSIGQFHDTLSEALDHNRAPSALLENLHRFSLRRSFWMEIEQIVQTL